VDKYPTLHGVIGGYNRGNHHANHSTVPLNLNEIRLCLEPADYLEHIEAIEITPAMVAGEILRYSNPSFLTSGKLFTPTIVDMRGLNGWRRISKDLGLLYLWTTLEPKSLLQFRLEMFIAEQVYVYSPYSEMVRAVVYMIPWQGGFLTKCWYGHDIMDVWPLLKIFGQTFSTINSDVVLRNAMQTGHTATLMLDEDVLKQLRDLGLFN